MNKEIKTIRRWIIFFMISLFLSGLTAIPLEIELAWLCQQVSPNSTMGKWLNIVYKALSATNRDFPFISYGFDWLAFAHFVLAILFVGPFKDPVRNKWVIDFGIIACLLILPFAFIAGYFRGIPLGWILIDCSFGVIGLIPLLICRSKINRLEQALKLEQSLSYTTLK